MIRGRFPRPIALIILIPSVHRSLVIISKSNSLFCSISLFSLNDVAPRIFVPSVKSFACFLGLIRRTVNETLILQLFKIFENVNGISISVLDLCLAPGVFDFFSGATSVFDEIRHSEPFEHCGTFSHAKGKHFHFDTTLSTFILIVTLFWC